MRLLSYDLLECLENESVAVDDDDPDDEEYNVLTELDKLKEFEKDKDELRMDRFTEIPSKMLLPMKSSYLRQIF